MRKQKGFSLIELLIVVAIILIIAAIAIPNLMRSRMAANEASAAQSLRVIVTGEISYLTTFPDTGYAANLAALGPPAAAGCPAGGPTIANACLVDWVLAQGTKSGYTFAATPAGGGVGGANTATFLATAIPQNTSSGTRSFCTDQSGVIHYDPTGALAASDAACVALNALQ